MAGYVDGGGVDDDGWLTTGDLGKIDESGRLTVTGRADDMLISGGRNIHPQAIESCLAACPGIRDVAVTGLPDPVWGDRIVALVVGDATPESIRGWCRTRLPGVALPRHIVRLPSLPRNATGKLERTALRRLAREAR
jgi:O-succinylbenzoic acid--CoA ligase